MDDFEKFYKSAIRFLSFRPRSEKELKDYLTKKECDPLISRRIVDSLTRDKFLNDEEFVRWWVEQRTILKPKASRIIKYELKQKGISRELIDNFYENEEESTSDFDKALKLAEKKMVRLGKIEDKRKIYEKLGRFLASKGFDWDTIKEVIDRSLSK
jgi:regulatory protein